MRRSRFRFGGRRSVRLIGHDYSAAATYFVTICTHDRLCWFGDVERGQLIPTPAGTIVDAVWRSLPERFRQVALDYYVVMPNHIHGVLSMSQGEASLGAVIRAFKAASTRLIRNSGHESFGWHRNYHEHTVRSNAALVRIRQYVQSNPQTWENDIFHPTREGL